MSEAPRKKRRFWGPRRWHRYLGAVFALPLLWLCVTGLLLQHQDWFGLNERTVSSEWLLRRYDQLPENKPREEKVGRFVISEWDETLFMDDAILQETGTLVGAVAKPAELLVAIPEAIFVYDSQGEYFDRLGPESLPGVPVSRLGLNTAKEVIVEVAGKSYLLSDDLLDFKEVASAEVVWSQPTETPERAEALSLVLAKDANFTWGRVITDLHSGSLFGKLGRFLVDLTGIAVIVLTLFGIRLLFRRT